LLDEDASGLDDDPVATALLFVASVAREHFVPPEGRRVCTWSPVTSRGGTRDRAGRDLSAVLCASTSRPPPRSMTLPGFDRMTFRLCQRLRGFRSAR
jgi:hypothetical protein